MSQPITIVMYHYVRPIRDSRYPSIKGLELELFIEQIQFFKKYYEIINIEDIIAAKENNQKLPPNSLLMTFDDGYLDHFNYVYPVLKHFGISGAFYVPAMCIVEDKVLDVNKIHFTLASVEDTALLVGDLKRELNCYMKDYDIDFFHDYYSRWAVKNRFDTKDVIFIKRMLQHVLPEELRNIICDHLFQKYVGLEEKAFNNELYMNHYQLKQMVCDGMHVGCHGYNHYWWDRLDSSELNKEIEKSILFLDSIGMDTENWTSCYPYGSVNDNVIETLEQYNCKLAMTTEVRVADLETDHKLRIPRIDTNDLPKNSISKPNEWYRFHKV